MKIDLSKYPPGTKFKTKCGNTVRLVGLSEKKSDCYIIEYLDENPSHTLVFLGYRLKDGTYPGLDIRNYIESVIQLDKYLVSFLRKDGTVGTTVVTNPTELTPEHFLLMCLRNESIYGMFNIGESIPDKVLSWSKIEE